MQEIWKRNKVLTRVLVEYAQLNRIKRIFDFTARSDYRELIDWDFVANATGAEVLYCFSVMGGDEDALIPFAKFMKNFALVASEEELLALKPETEIEDVLIRDARIQGQIYQVRNGKESCKHSRKFRGIQSLLIKSLMNWG